MVYSDDDPDRRGNSSDSDQESDQESDPIIRRIPVYYTPQYLSSLTLLQYPDRPPRPHTSHPLLPPSLRPSAGSSTKKEAVLQVKHKPNTQHLNLSLPIERNEDRWNEDVAQDLAKGILDEPAEEGSAKGKKRRGEDEEARRQQEREDRRLDRMEMSSISVPDVTNYLVGVLRDDALHLAPVTQTYQLRPSLTYLDNLLALDRRAKREAAAKEDDSDVEVSDTELRQEVAKAVQVSVKQSAEGGTAAGKGGAGAGGGGNGRAGAGLFKPMRDMEGEAWVPLKHCDADTGDAEEAYEGLLVAEDRMGAKLTSLTKPKEYLMS